MRVAFLGLVATLAALCAAAEPFPKEEIEAERKRLALASFEHTLELQKRLLRVADAIRRHGAPLCGDKLSPLVGVVATTEDDLPEAYKKIAQEVYSIRKKEVRVLWVLPDSPADRAGVRAGDLVRSVGGRRIIKAASMYRWPTKMLEDVIPLEIQRGEESLSLEMEHVRGCYWAAALLQSDVVNAYANRVWMVVTSGLMRASPVDDELAITIGHEMAHNLLGHPWSRPKFEREADYLGCYLAAKAGFDISTAGDVWQRWSLESMWSLESDEGFSHPSSPERSLALEATVQEIRRKVERGEPLEPERTQ